MQALFYPPSTAGAECIANLTGRIQVSKSEADAQALGFMVRAGHEAFVELAQRDGQGVEMAGKALHFALGIGLGVANPALAGVLGITNQVARKLLGTGVDKLTKEGLNNLLGAMGSGDADAAQRWKRLVAETDRSFQDSLPIQRGFGDGLSNFDHLQ